MSFFFRREDVHAKSKRGVRELIQGPSPLWAKEANTTIICDRRWKASLAQTPGSLWHPVRWRGSPYVFQEGLSFLAISILGQDPTQRSMLSLTQQHDCHRRSRLANALGVTLLLLMTASSVEGWGSSNGDADMSIYSDAYSRDWLYDGSSIALKIDGCVRSFVQDGEDSGCMEQESDTGTTYWYQMSNCKRANVAYSLYSGTSCSSSNFKEAVRIFRHSCLFIHTRSRSFPDPSNTVCWHCRSIWVRSSAQDLRRKQSFRQRRRRRRKQR